MRPELNCAELIEKVVSAKVRDSSTFTLLLRLAVSVRKKRKEEQHLANEHG